MCYFAFCVTTPAEIAPEQAKVSLAARIGWIVLICVTLYVCYFSHLGAIGFVGPDEPRYAWIARAMVETGDWVTPRLYDKPWFEKPPLYYWGAAICFKLLGVNEVAARLPSAVSALLATLAMAWLAWRVYGAETARWLLLLLPTTVGMIGFSHAAATDMPFAGMLTVAMVCAAVVIGLTERNPEDGLAQHAGPIQRDGTTRSRLLAAILFGLFLGLAVLAKGPAGIILCGGAVFFWALFTKRWRNALRLFHPAGIVVFCATALPWYILCARRNPDFLHIFIIEHNFKRYLTPEFQHIRPFWFYAPVLLIAFLPWTGALLLALAAGLARLLREKRVSTLVGFSIAWAIFCVGFFSTSKSKLPGYILPAIPAVSLILCYVVVGLVVRKARSVRLTFLLSSVVLFALFAVMQFMTQHLSSGNEKFGITVGLTIAAMGAANLILGLAIALPKPNTVAAGVAVLPLLLPLLFADKLLRSFFYFDPSARTIARELKLQRIPTEELYVKSMPRGQHYGLNFYLHEEIKDWDPTHPANGYVLMGSKACSALAEPSPVCRQLPFDLAHETGRFLFLVTIANSAGAADGKAQ